LDVEQERGDSPLLFFIATAAQDAKLFAAENAENAECSSRTNSCAAFLTISAFSAAAAFCVHCDASTRILKNL
jgi:hypothetical protein